MSGFLQFRCSKPNGRTYHWHPVREFVVSETQSVQAYNHITEAIDALEKAKANEDSTAFVAARTAILTSAGRAKTCASCRESSKKSKENPDTECGKATAEWQRLKTEACCVDCGTDRATEMDHDEEYKDNKIAYDKMRKDGATLEEAEAKYPKDERKIDECSHIYTVEGVRAERKKCTPRCKMDHRLQPTSNSAECNRADPDKVKREDYETQEAYTKAVRHARNCMEKRELSDKVKRRIGRCANPECPQDGLAKGVCTRGFEPCFEFHHRVEATKGRGISDIINDRRCLKTALKELRIEWPKTCMLCANCHHEVTHCGMVIKEEDEVATRPEVILKQIEAEWASNSASGSAGGSSSADAALTPPSSPSTKRSRDSDDSESEEESESEESE
jgi:hypothetical protein